MDYKKHFYNLLVGKNFRERPQQRVTIEKVEKWFASFMSF